MRLEQDSCIPLYYQIKEAIKADIVSKKITVPTAP